MNVPFDPYHQWLGISPKDQPPNHYRLLGIDLFESDANVISNAADQRMAHVRSFQAGQHAAESQRVLNEISAARVCLLNAKKKAAYDAALSASNPCVDQDDGTFKALGLDVALHAPRAVRPRKPKSKAVTIVAVAAVICVAVVVLVALLLTEDYSTASWFSPVRSRRSGWSPTYRSKAEDDPRARLGRPFAQRRANPWYGGPSENPDFVPANERPNGPRVHLQSHTYRSSFSMPCFLRACAELFLKRHLAPRPPVLKAMGHQIRARDCGMAFLPGGKSGELLLGLGGKPRPASAVFFHPFVSFVPFVD